MSYVSSVAWPSLRCDFLISRRLLILLFGDWIWSISDPEIVVFAAVFRKIWVGVSNPNDAFRSNRALTTAAGQGPAAERRTLRLADHGLELGDGLGTPRAGATTEEEQDCSCCFFPFSLSACQMVLRSVSSCFEFVLTSFVSSFICDQFVVRFFLSCLRCD